MRALSLWFSVLLLVGSVYADENIVDYSDTSLPILNNELRKLNDGIRNTHSIPSGGTAGQVLVKDTATNYDTSWTTLLSVPVATVLPYAGSTAPTGYLLCNGATISKTTYAALFAITGHTYGADPGGGNFILPNLKGKIPVGFNAAETEFDALGETGGSKVPALLAHVHSVNTATPGGSFIGVSAAYQATPQPLGSTEQSGSQTAGNLQPYLTLQYIIKY